eukprot:scaffold246_cov242-Pinguiococcus_pyrenoidosus.AAC.10
MLAIGCSPGLVALPDRSPARPSSRWGTRTRGRQSQRCTTEQHRNEYGRRRNQKEGVLARQCAAIGQPSRLTSTSSLRLYPRRSWPPERGCVRPASAIVAPIGASAMAACWPVLRRDSRATAMTPLVTWASPANYDSEAAENPMTASTGMIPPQAALRSCWIHQSTPSGHPLGASTRGSGCGAEKLVSLLCPQHRETDRISQSLASPCAMRLGPSIERRLRPDLPGDTSCPRVSRDGVADKTFT